MNVSKPTKELARWFTLQLRMAPEPVLHPSERRLRSLGLFMAIGQPLFGLIWIYLYPQPFDSLVLRCAFGCLGLLLLWPRVAQSPESRFAQNLAALVFWLGLPLFFFWMYLCNGGNTVWLVSICGMVIIYYHLSDWRLATVGVLTAAFLALLVRTLVWPGTDPLLTQPDWGLHAVLFGFCWLAAITLGASSANLRREHIRHTLTTMGIMAHELRTPLATIAMIGDVLQSEAKSTFRHDDDRAESMRKIDRMASRLHGLVRQMHHQIDTQIANAQLMQLPVQQERVSAYEVLNEVVGRYPYRTPKERECVALAIRTDFTFYSSFSQFTQVIDNLMKNALRALLATDRPLEPGDLRIEVSTDGAAGIITISDRGRGIPAHLLPRIFEPFFSTSRGTGHGLGLPFCQRVVLAAKGEIVVESEWQKGTRFTIRLPITPQDAMLKMAHKQQLA